MYTNFISKNKCHLRANTYDPIVEPKIFLLVSGSYCITILKESKLSIYIINGRLDVGDLIKVYMSFIYQVLVINESDSCVHYTKDLRRRYENPRSLDFFPLQKQNFS